MEEFHVFLAHNSLDKSEVQLISAALKRRNLNPWIDDEQIRPGRPFQDEIQQAIPLVKSAAIFFGVRGVGRWQSLELRTLINQCVKRNIPVIPVLLPGVNQLPENLLFLEDFRWVCFSESIDDERALSLLEWGITGIKPQPQNTSNQKSATTQPQSIQTDDLASEKGIDYTRLRDLLAEKDWYFADSETQSVMNEIMGGKKGSYFTSDQFLNFPCTDLFTIDRLWFKYSEGRFGFRVQTEIYWGICHKADGEYHAEAWEEFGDRVGWRVKERWISTGDITYNIYAPFGHLPASWGFHSYHAGANEGNWWFLGWKQMGNGRFALASRFINCCNI